MRDLCPVITTGEAEECEGAGGAGGARAVPPGERSGPGGVVNAIADGLGGSGNRWMEMRCAKPERT
jgi:hypothetical protein